MPPLSRTGRTPLPLFLLALSLGCTHTDSFAAQNYGAVGPFAPGPEARLATATNGSWSENGGGILFVGQCLMRPAAPHTTIPSMIVLPAAGGSAILDLCEAPLSLQFPTELDSAETILSAALGADGRLLYVESISNNTAKPIPCSCVPFPVASHAELWLTDTTAPFSRRRKLLALYHDSVGRPTVPDNQVNWLVDAVWSGPSTFIALGQNVRPSEFGRTAGPLLAMVRGTIDAAGASLAPIPGTDRARLFSLAEANATIVFSRDSLVLERVPSGGGAPAIAAVIPAFAGRSLQDVSCKAELCLVVTQEPGPANGVQSTFWTLTLNSGALAPLRSYPVAISRARISPASNSVVVIEGAGMYLFTDLFP